MSENAKDDRPLRVWVWEDVLEDYTAGMAVVVAHDEKEAAAIMEKQMPDYVVKQLPFAKAEEITTPTACFVYGGG